MSYEQIKNKVVPSAKRTAQTVEKWLARLPNIPEWAFVAGKVTIAMLRPQLQMVLQNPLPFLAGAGAAVVAGAILGPGAVALLLAAGASAVISYAVIAAVVCVVLAAMTVYNNRVAVAKAFVVVLEAI